MRNWILGGLLACVSSAGVAYVLARNSTGSHCGPCIEKPSATETVQLPALSQGSWSDKGECEHCSKCKAGDSKVVDVVDLDRSFRMADGSPKPVVSFEEPPLAKPRGEVMPVKFEEPAAVEVLPMPREVKSQSNVFMMFHFLADMLMVEHTSGYTLPSGRFVNPHPTISAPDPVFPLARERDSVIEPKAENRPGNSK